MASSEGVIVDSHANGSDTHPGSWAQEEADNKCKLVDGRCNLT